MGAPSDTGFFKSFLIARPGALLFFLLLIVQLVFTRFAILKAERELPLGNHYFSGVITDPGVILSEDPGQGRTQTVRLDNGIRALLWMEQPGKRGDRVSGTAVFTVGEEPEIQEAIPSETTCCQKEPFGKGEPFLCGCYLKTGSFFHLGVYRTA